MTEESGGLRESSGGGRTALVADDHSLLLAGISLLLRDEMEFDEILEAESFGAALKLLEVNPRTELAIVDLGMPGMAGAKSVKQLRVAHPSLRIIVFTASEDAYDVDAALAAGANGFIPKSFDDDKVVAALKDVLSGGTFKPALQYLKKSQRQPDAPSQNQEWTRTKRQIRLTSRQQDLLACVGQGLSNREIAEKFNISERTVANHMNGLFAIFNVRNRTELAVRFAHTVNKT